MLRLGRPVGAYPRLEARLAAIHLGSRDEAEPTVEDTGCDECGGMGGEGEPKPCSGAEKGTAEEAGGDKGDCGCDDDSDSETKYAGSDADCGCDQ